MDCEVDAAGVTVGVSQGGNKKGGGERGLSETKRSFITSNHFGVINIVLYGARSSIGIAICSKKFVLYERFQS